MRIGSKLTVEHELLLPLLRTDVPYSQHNGFGNGYCTPLAPQRPRVDGVSREPLPPEKSLGESCNKTDFNDQPYNRLKCSYYHQRIV
jgi:hypothetical protein